MTGRVRPRIDRTDEDSRAFERSSGPELVEPAAESHDVVHMGTTPHPNDAAPAPARVLVVDDDAGIRALLEVTVTLDPRFELVGSASCGAECLRLIRERDCRDLDVVLLDVTLPDTDGIELLQVVRSLVGDVRIALFTGWSDGATLERAQAAGADAVFPKDGKAALLLDRLAALCAETSSVQPVA